MSIHTENPKKRLFPYIAEHTFEGNRYKEQFYYRIKEVIYNQRKGIEEVSVSILVNVMGYLNGEGYSEVPVTFRSPTPDDVVQAVAEYETLIKLNKG